MADMEGGQRRVMAKETNNRRGPGKGGKVPVKSGAKSGFGSNKMKGKGIFRALKGNG